MLELYQVEEDGACQRVRSLLTDLGLDYLVRNEPRDPAQRIRMRQLGAGDERVPALVDTDMGVFLQDPDEIVYFLQSMYGDQRERFLATRERLTARTHLQPAP